MKRSLFPVAILAGGMAKRLWPLTQSRPKALIDVNGSPFIHHQLHLLRKSGVRRVIVCIGYLGEKIRDAVGDGEKFDLTIEYSNDGENSRGTGGAIKKALPLLGEKFFVLYGDSYLDCDYAAIQDTFLRNDKKGLMTIFQNRDQGDRSNVEYSNGIIRKYDKIHRTPGMLHIDYGVGVFHQEAFRNVPVDTPYDLAVVYQELLSEGQLAAFECRERFYEIGSVDGINELSKYLRAKNRETT